MKKAIVVKGKDVDVKAVVNAVKANAGATVWFADLTQGKIREALSGVKEQFRFGWFTNTNKRTFESKMQGLSTKYQVVATIEPTIQSLAHTLSIKKQKAAKKASITPALNLKVGDIVCHKFYCGYTMQSWCFYRVTKVCAASVMTERLETAKANESVTGDEHDWKYEGQIAPTDKVSTDYDGETRTRRFMLNSKGEYRYNTSILEKYDSNKAYTTRDHSYND